MLAPSLPDLLRETRLAARSLARSRGFSVAAVLTLALGIGAVTAVFGLVDAYLFAPLPFAHPERLVVLRDVQPSYGPAPASFEELADWRRHAGSFDAISAYDVGSFTSLAGELPERVRAGWAGEGFFALLGIEPERGRSLGAGDHAPGAAPVAVVSREFARRAWGEASPVGRPLRLGEGTFTVVGVVPPVPLIAVGDEPSFWLPLEPHAPWRDRGSHYLSVLARRRPEVSLAAARAEVAELGRRLGEEHGNGHGIEAVALREALFGHRRGTFLALLGAVGFVLLIAIVNIANLLLARAAARRREVAVRTAIGSSRWRLARQVLAEGLVIAGAGGALGLLIGLWATGLLPALLPPDVPPPPEVGLDLRLLTFAAAVSLASAAVFGLAPVLFELRRPAQALGSRAGAGDARGHQRARRALIVVELALCLVLAVGAGLMARSLGRVLAVDPGIALDHRLTFTVSLPPSRYPEGTPRLAAWQELAALLQRVPAVRTVAAASALPLAPDMNGSFEVAGRPPYAPDDQPFAEKRIVTPGWFEALGIAVEAGRGFTAEDRLDGAQAVVISRRMADQLWPGEDALGRRIRSFSCGEECWETVVGVVEDVHSVGLDQPPPLEIYYPATQLPLTTYAVVAVTRGDPAAVVEEVRRTVARFDPTLPVSAVRSLDEVYSEAAAGRRLPALLSALFSGLALALAAVGLAGVISYSVQQRRREMAVRLALGDSPGGLARRVLGEGLRLTGLGVLLGGLGALALAAAIESQLYAVSPLDPAAFAAAGAALAAIALVATLVPARRAAATDPAQLLRDG